MDIIIIISLYTADAPEEALFHSVQDDSYLDVAENLDVMIEHDAVQKTLTIIDTGVSMSKACFSLLSWWQIR